MPNLAKALFTRPPGSRDGRDNEAAGSSSSSSTAIERGGSEEDAVLSPSPVEHREASPEMAEVLWANLPEALMQTVLRFLPAESVFKFRTVCKRWREILTDPSFLETRLGAAHRSPFCILSDIPNKRFAVYNIGSDKWFHPPYDNFFTGPFPTERTVLTGSAAGLVLLEVLPEPQMREYHVRDGYVHGMANKKTLLLLNPVNKSCREMPQLEDGDEDEVRCLKVVGIDYDPQIGSYQILARSTLFQIGGMDNVRPGRSQFHVYDLKANSWEMIYDSSKGTGPEEWNMSYRVLDPAVLHGGFWYYLTYAHHFWGPRNRDSTPHIFRVKMGVAEALPAPLPHEGGMIMDFLHLFVCQGKLILAGSIKTKDNLILNEWMSFRFWKLDERHMEWVDYLKMPLYLVKELGDRRVKRFALDLDCSVDGDCICFWVGRPAGKESRTIEMIMYSISKDSWQTVSSEVEMPRAHFESRGWFGYSYARGLSSKPFSYFLFKPNLNITL